MRLRFLLLLAACLPLGMGCDQPTGAAPAAAAVIQLPPVKPFVVGRSKQWALDFMRTYEGPYDYDRFFARFTERFRGMPYGAGDNASLRGYQEGQTLVNFETMDCVTFIENFVALARAVRQWRAAPAAFPTEEARFRLLVHHLNQVRYYNGDNCTWDDRIYYFTHALEELEAQGLVRNIADLTGEPFRKTINYLSSNKKKYPGIHDWGRIGYIERKLSRRRIQYYPLAHIDRYAPLARTGDIVALATSVAGLDVSHCGFIHVEDGDRT